MMAAGHAVLTMALAQKKAVLRSFANILTWGYLPQTGFLVENQIQLIKVDGRITTITLSGLKHIAYVKDFNLDDAFDPERIGRRVFPARPRGDGLWVRLTLRDHEVLEGLASLDLASLDSLVKDQGLFLTPPDLRSNTQRLFIPRPALISVEVLGFVAAPSRRSSLSADPAKHKTLPGAQPGLFDQ
jgi:hypothetical protein